MKKLIILISIILLMSCLPNGNNGNKPIDLNGGWKLIEGEHHQPDGDIIKYPIGKGEHYKLFTDKYFMTVYDDTSKNHSSIYPGFNGGTYTLEKDFLTVKYFVHTEEFAIGKTYFHLVKLEDNKLTILPADENGNQLKFGFFEQWQKLE